MSWWGIQEWRKDRWIRRNLGSRTGESWVQEPYHQNNGQFMVISGGSQRDSPKARWPWDTMQWTLVQVSQWSGMVRNSSADVGKKLETNMQHRGLFSSAMKLCKLSSAPQYQLEEREEKIFWENRGSPNRKFELGIDWILTRKILGGIRTPEQYEVRYRTLSCCFL